MMISPSVALLCSTSSCSLTASTFKVQMYGDRIQHFPCVKIQNQIRNAFKFQNTDLLGQAAADRRGTKVLVVYRSFVSRSKYLLQPQFGRNSYRRRGSSISSSCIASQIASSAFTYGTAAVLPFYTLMLLAPNSALTKKSMESTMPYVVLGILYAYLLYISWTPETLKTIFATKYLLPELPGMLRMFSNEMTMASAWIHLLAIDLFAARQVFQDGLKNNIETRHSVSLCLLFCPIGILTHVVTKILTKKFYRQHRHSNTIDARSSKCTKHM